MSKALPHYIHRLRDLYAPGMYVEQPSGWVRSVCLPYTAGRLLAAWWVLTGRAYAFEWPRPGDLEEVALDHVQPGWRIRKE